MFKNIYETCPYCDDEVKIKKTGGNCPNCNHFVKPCSLCEMDVVNCGLCDKDKTGTYMKVATQIRCCTMDDVGENEGGYFTEIYYEKYSKTEWFDYVITHKDIKEEMENPTKHIAKYVDNLIKEIIKDKNY